MKGATIATLGIESAKLFGEVELGQGESLMTMATMANLAVVHHCIVALNP